MNRFHAPDDSVTEQSVRMAWHYEYMVPIETAWELEQQLNRALAECEKLRLVQKGRDEAISNLAQTIREAAE
jgi:hypothetical protein